MRAFSRGGVLAGLGTQSLMTDWVVWEGAARIEQVGKIDCIRESEREKSKTQKFPLEY